MWSKSSEEERHRSQRPDNAAYLVCGTPRTGSTLLCGLLAATGVAGKPESYFRLHDVGSYAEAWGVQAGPDGTLDYGEYSEQPLPSAVPPMSHAALESQREPEKIEGLVLASDRRGCRRTRLYGHPWPTFCLGAL